jgi:hypothetical protein
MTCRDEVLAAAKDLCTRLGRDTFTLAEVLAEMRTRKSTYTESTIRTHVTSRMCRNASTHHATTFDDFESLGGGVYRLLHMAG